MEPDRVPSLRLHLVQSSMVCLVAGACLGGFCQFASAQDVPRSLVPGKPVEGLVDTDHPHAYTLDLGAGDFVRVFGTASSDLLFRLIGPAGDTIEYTRSWSDAPIPAILSHVADAAGQYRLELFRWPGDSSAVQYDLLVDELLSSARYARRLDSLRTDQRVSWLAQHVLPLPSLSLDETDFSDLDPLRREIGDARIVLLGEESHASGTTIRGMSRLVQFLHQEMGFDVLAFESSLFAMWQAEELLRTGQDPVTALQQGLLGTWSRSHDFEPMARYLGKQAGGPHPIDVAGVDFQSTLPVDRERLIPGLLETATGIGLGGEGRDVSPGFWATLSDFMAGRHSHPDSLPAPQMQMDVVSDLRWLAERIADSASARSSDGARTQALWAQVTRSLAEFVETVWRDPSFESPMYRERRDQQMARNLIWLAREQFPDRKVIVWAHNYHVLRHPHRVYADAWVSMGQRIWETFGEHSFVIAATAFSGRYMWRAMGREIPDFAVVTDQDARFELEELLAATGLQDGVLMLRNPAPGGDWLRSEMLSRMPQNYYTVPGTWPDQADAVLFLRAIAPRRTPPDAR